MNLEVLSEAVRQSDRVYIEGSNSKVAFGFPVEGVKVSAASLEGIICYEPDDRVVEVWAGTKIADLQQVLKEKGQCLPILDQGEYGSLLAGVPGTVGGLISMNLPHGFYAQCGGPKEWVLGAKVMRAGGEVVKSGGKVVKNVAGFDFHRFVVGARGSLGLVVSVTLKVFPVKSVPMPACERLREWAGNEQLAVQRVLPSCFSEVAERLSARLFATDRASSTLWYEPDSDITRYDADWILKANCGDSNLAFSELDQKLIKKAKQAVDPAGKFNPGVLGCL